MKVAVINFSGNVGKSTVARHLLLPRITGAELVTIESLNARDGDGPALRGRQFGALQEYLQTVDSAVVDIGASNVEELLHLMRHYRGSQDDFDHFVVPTVPAIKQQQDTIATLVELGRLGVSPSRVRLVFNMLDYGEEFAEAFDVVLAFVAEHPMARANPACCLAANEVYARIKAGGQDLATLAQDQTDYKALIVRAKDKVEKVALANKLATRRLAMGVLPELDACFSALDLSANASAKLATVRQPA